MTIFELVKIALDELYTEGTQLYGLELDEQITRDLNIYRKAMSASLTRRERHWIMRTLPGDSRTFTNMSQSHGDYLVQVFEKIAAKRGAMFDKPSMRVSCLGGGPGSDIIAVLKYLDEHKHEAVEKLTCYLLDQEQAWADIWTELNESLTPKVALNVNFQPLDITDAVSWKSQKKFLQADLFTMIYFVSEVFSLDRNGVVAKSWRDIFDCAKSGALFVYVDNGYDEFTSYFDTQWKAAKLACIISGENERWTPRLSEQASELGEYRKKFGQDPKIQAWLTYRVLRKP